MAQLNPLARFWRFLCSPNCSWPRVVHMLSFQCCNISMLTNLFCTLVSLSAQRPQFHCWSCCFCSPPPPPSTHTSVFLKCAQFFSWFSPPGSAIVKSTKWWSGKSATIELLLSSELPNDWLNFFVIFVLLSLVFVLTWWFLHTFLNKILMNITWCHV